MRPPWPPPQEEAAKTYKWSGQAPPKLTKGMALTRRWAIKDGFERICGSPPEEEWDWPTGCVSFLCDYLQIPTNSKRLVRHVLTMITETEDGKEVDLSAGCRERGFAKARIKDDTDASNVVLTALERGLGLGGATILVNEWFRANGEEPCCYGAVQHYATTTPVMEMAKRRTKKSGKTEAGTTWAQARLAQCRQWKLQLTPGSDLPEGTPRFFLNGIAWWDEHHKKIRLGHSSKHEYRVRRDENGNPCVEEEGGVLPDCKETTTTKFPGEARLCPGVAAVTSPLPAGKSETQQQEYARAVGKRMAPFDYTGKLVVGPNAWQKAKNAEKNRVKKLKGIWGADGHGYEERYGNSAEEFYSRPAAVSFPNKKADLVEMCRNRELDPKGTMPVLRERLLPLLVEDARLEREAEQAARAARGVGVQVDLRPFWEQMLDEKLEKTMICVIKLMDHVIDESTKAFAGSTHADDFFIFHDALLAWWEPDAQAHMASRGFENRQLRAYGDTNKGTRYHLKLVGDSPELCRGLDAHGFADLASALVRHCSVTSHYDPRDMRRFSMGTPKQVASSLLRCWEVAPTAERIVEDIMDLPRVLDIIIENDGCVVRDEFLRTGRRSAGLAQGARGAAVQNKNNVRNRQRKDETTEDVYHPDAQVAHELLKTPGNKTAIDADVEVWRTQAGNAAAAAAATGDGGAGGAMEVGGELGGEPDGELGAAADVAGGEGDNGVL